MAVDARWLAVGCPSGVRNTADSLGWLGQIHALGLLVNQITELLDLSDLLASKHILLLSLLDD